MRWRWWRPSTCSASCRKGTHDYAKFLHAGARSRRSRGSAGLEPTGIAGMAYNPFTKSFRLAADPAVNYMMAFRRTTDG